MKRVCLLLAFVLFCCSMTGCDDPKREDYKRLDEDKAAEVALSYMNEKYDETFFVVKSEIDAEHGYVPGSIQDAWVDVTVAIEGDEAAKKYTVRLSLNEDRVNYDIDWDNYMKSLVAPWLKKEIDAMFSTLKISEYFTTLGWAGNKGAVGFSSDFPVLQDSDTLREIADIYKLTLSLHFNLPESAYTSSIKKDIEEVCKPIFLDDAVSIDITTYTNDFYFKYKETYGMGDRIPDGSIENERRSDSIKLNWYQ